MIRLNTFLMMINLTKGIITGMICFIICFIISLIGLYFFVTSISDKLSKFVLSIPLTNIITYGTLSGIYFLIHRKFPKKP